MIVCQSLRRLNPQQATAEQNKEEGLTWLWRSAERGPGAPGAPGEGEATQPGWTSWLGALATQTDTMHAHARVLMKPLDQRFIIYRNLSPSTLFSVFVIVSLNSMFLYLDILCQAIKAIYSDNCIGLLRHRHEQRHQAADIWEAQFLVVRIYRCLNWKTKLKIYILTAMSRKIMICIM